MLTGGEGIVRVVDEGHRNRDGPAGLLDDLELPRQELRLSVLGFRKGREDPPQTISQLKEKTFVSIW